MARPSKKSAAARIRTHLPRRQSRRPHRPRHSRAWLRSRRARRLCRRLRRHTEWPRDRPRSRATRTCRRAPKPWGSRAGLTTQRLEHPERGNCRASDAVGPDVQRLLPEAALDLSVSGAAKERVGIYIKWRAGPMRRESGPKRRRPSEWGVKREQDVIVTIQPLQDDARRAAP